MGEGKGAGVAGVVHPETDTRHAASCFFFFFFFFAFFFFLFCFCFPSSFRRIEVTAIGKS